MSLNVNYDSYLIKSKLFSKIALIIYHVNNNNYYYITNLKDYIRYTLTNNNCNINNNNLLNELLNKMNNWDSNNLDINKKIYDDMGYFIYNYDIYDEPMYYLLQDLNNLII